MPSHPIPYGSHHPLHIHLSSLPSQQSLIVLVPTTETTASSLLQHDTSPFGSHHPSHAHHASSDPSSGLLLRVVANKLALEITSLALSASSSSSAAGISLPRPVRFVFPSPLLSTPGIFTSPATGSVSVLAMTESGYIYTLVLPLDGKRWEGVLESNEGWSQEHAVAGAEGRELTTFHPVDEQTVLVGTGDGVVIRLEQDQNSWRETDLKPSSYLSSFASLFTSSRTITSSPSPHSASPSSSKQSALPAEVISLSSYLQEDTLGLAFSLSRDRKLRVWNLITGACVRTVDVVVRGGNALAIRGDSSGRLDSADILLPASEEGPASYLRVISRPSSSSSHQTSSSSYDYHLAVFLPFASTSSSSGGRFVFYGIQVDTARSQFGEIVVVGEKTCASGTGGAELQDFDVVLGGGREGDDPSTIWAVWDVRGETVVQRSGIRSALDEMEGSDASGGGADEMADEWETLLPLPSPAFTSTYFEDLLQSSSHSPAELFTSHLFHPSRFSPASLSSALDAYIAALVSALPHSSASHPAALSASYAILSDRVAATVACHIELETSAQTGELLQAEFDKKVRMEWLGFLARVEDAERDARWAVALVKSHGGGGIVVVQRDGLIVPTKRSSVEIVSSLASVPSDNAARATFLSLLPGSLYLSHPSLAPPHIRQASLHLASLAHTLASVLSPPAMLVFESDVVTLTSAAPSLSVEDASLDLYANRVEPFIDERIAFHLRDGIGGAGDSFESAVKTVLDWTISPIDPLLPAPAALPSIELSTPTAVALLSSSFRATVELRFNLARNVLLILLFAMADLSDDSLESSSLISLVSSALSVVQCLGNLKWLAGVTGEASTARPRNGAATQDENALFDRFDSLKMSPESPSSSHQPSSATIPLPSLIQSLISSSPVRLDPISSNPLSSSIPSATAAFLSSTSLASLRTLVQALPPDVRLANELLSIGHVQAAYAFCARYPLEEGLAFVKAKAAMVMGKVEESERLFEEVATAFTATSSPTGPTLLAALPPTLTAGSLLDYYRHVSTFYDRLSLHASIVKFANLAIEAAAERAVLADAGKSKIDTRDLWAKLFKSIVALGRYEDAYMVLTTNPYRDSNSDAISHLITVMCHANEVDKLTQFTFVGLQDVVERTLAFKARHSDPMAVPNYLLVLYSWHICRGDYRKAASAMYQQAHRLGEVNGPFTDIGPRQAKSYLLAINALSLVDKKHAWLAAPVSSSRPSPDKPRKRQKLTSHIPEDKFSSSARSKEVEIIELEDVRREYNLVLSTLILATKFPESFQSAGILSAENAVALFVQAGMFDTAILTARQLQVDMTGIFQRLAIKCIDAARSNVDDDLRESSWLLSSPLVSSLDGSIAARAEQYLQILLSRHDDESTFWRYRAAVLEKMLEVDRNLPLPSWLVDFFASKDPELLVNAYLKYDLFEAAGAEALNILRKAPATDVLPPSKSAVAYLPYNLFDLVIRVVDSSSTSEAEDQVPASSAQRRAKGLAGRLKREVERRLLDLESITR